MIAIYRLSDNGYIKPKLPCATKMACLENFKSTYGIIDHLILDNCSSETIYALENGKYAKEIHKTNLGNAPSFLYAMEIAITSNEAIYFVEDDYIHCGNIKSAIMDGLSMADYCTLYDHPDKYSAMYNRGETCKVLRKNNKHWRTTASTTMTFACMSKTIKHDVQIFRSVCEGKFHPNDHEIFQKLQSECGRSLVLCMPGMALHADLTTYLSNIDIIGFEIDEWALDAIIDIAIASTYATRDDEKINDMKCLLELKAKGTKGKLVLAQSLETIMSR